MEIILGALHKLGFDGKLFLFNFINFLIIFFLLNKYLFPVLAKAIEKRKKTIEEGLENAEKAKTALMTAESEKEKLIISAKVEANAILTKASEDSKEISQASEENAKIKAKDILEKAELEIESMKKDSLDQIKKEAVDIIVDGIGSFVLSSKDNQAEFIKAQISGTK